ncbi:SSI family serine proteinase inhibitor [Streptomyces sp. NPDC048659]|uniref:SSI family serine proteinase inhibitor n=1 Tax=Streptomyces sp. NPDC048659 TaxID=3155489 RepID=UPI0034236D91
MRYFRTLGATALATTTGLALIATAITSDAEAEAAPAGLYPPSALVLTVGKGERAATATVDRAVTLVCSPTPGGTHPAPKEACAELVTVGGDLSRLAGGLPGERPCTREWDPIVVTGAGVWRGKRVNWTARYGNACELREKTGERSVFAF